MSRAGFIQSDLDLKMLVLYIMDHAAAPISFLQLLELALCDSGVDYFSLHQAVSHLVQRENLSLEDDKYTITEKGRRNSEICENSLPFSVRQKCDENLSKINELLMREQQVQGTVIANEDETVTIHLQLSDDKGPLMDVKLLAPSIQSGEALVNAFKRKPEQVYHKMMELLSESI